MTATPAAAVRARGAAAYSKPPTPPVRDRRKLLDQLVLVTAAGTLSIGPAIIGDPTTSSALGETSLITMTVNDEHGIVRAALTDQLLVVDGARMTVDGIDYVVQGYRGSKDLELTFEDAASWQFKFFRSFRAFPRTRFTRAQAFRELVREAGSAPLVPLRAWIPELNDIQRVAAATPTDGSPTTKSGTGSSLSFKVKGTKATAHQKAVLDATLGECKAQGCSRRVMIGTVMMKTQESVMGEDDGQTGNDDVGDSQQGRNWISEANAKDAAKTTRAFLLGHDARVGGNDPSVKGWKQRFGSLRTDPGSLEAAVKSIQISVGGYGQWEAEATKTVDAWIGKGGTADDGVYEFTRGDKDGSRETSWTATGRWAEEVSTQRWAMLNTLCWASEDEMRAAAPALHLVGDEPWILGDGPAADASTTRATDETTLDVLTTAWGLLPGAALSLDDALGVLEGRWIMSRVDGVLFGDQATITLRRPTALAPEPAVSESAGGSEDDGSSSLADRLYEICQQISSQGRDYVWGGGHGKLSAVQSTRSGLDCSGSCSLALWEAEMFKGDVGITSGTFASSWGKAGKGKHFTVWASSEHVWIEFHGSGRDGHRFDTSPHGDGGRGPRLRTSPRGHDGFTARHWSSAT